MQATKQDQVAFTAMESVEIFAGALRAAREARNMSQTAVGEQVGVTQQAYARWENALGEPAPNVVFELERALRLRAGALSGHLGYGPVRSDRGRIRVIDAILTDRKLSDRGRDALIAMYDALTGDGADR